MNRIYRSIWNEVSRTFVATAEIVRSRGKAASRSQGLEASLAALEAGDQLGAGGHPAHAPPATRLRSMLRPMALEQRFMFDGAAVATVDAHVNDVPVAEASALADAFAAHAEQSPPVRDEGRESSLATAPVLVREAVPELNHGRREVVFIDTQVADYASLLGGIGQGIEVRLIDGAQDGVAQIAQWAETHSGYDAIHLFSHGSSGSVTLGSVNLSNANLDAYQSQLATIGAALTVNGDILVYGCKVAAGQPGVDLLGRLAEVTGSDIAASTDLTGAATLGGNWQLESVTGSVEAPSIDLSRDYAGILGTTNMTGDVDAYSGTNGEADIFVLPAGAGSSISFNAWGGLFNNNGQWYQNANIIVISNFDVSQDKIDLSALSTLINPSNVPNYAIKVAYGTDFSTYSSYDINLTSAQYNGTEVSNWKGGTTGAWLEFNDDGGNPFLNAFFPGVDENTFTLANFIFPVAGPAAPGAPDLIAASDTGISSTDNVTGSTTPTFTGAGASAGATIKLYESSTLLGTTTADASGNWTITSSTLGAGAHSITAKQTVGGTESAASSPLSVTIDTSAPTASVTSVAVKPGTSVTAAQSSETGKAYPGELRGHRH